MVVHSNYHRYVQVKWELSIFRWLVHCHMTSIANFVSTFEAIEITKLTGVRRVSSSSHFLFRGWLLPEQLPGWIIIFP